MYSRNQAASVERRRRTAVAQSTRFDHLEPRSSVTLPVVVLTVLTVLGAAGVMTGAKAIRERLQVMRVEGSTRPGFAGIGPYSTAKPVAQPSRAGSSFDIRRLGVSLLLPAPVTPARHFAPRPDVASLSLVRFVKARGLELSLSSATGELGQSLRLAPDPLITAGQSSPTHPLSFRARLGRPLDNASYPTPRKGSGIQYA